MRYVEHGGNYYQAGPLCLVTARDGTSDNWYLPSRRSRTGPAYTSLLFPHELLEEEESAKQPAGTGVLVAIGVQVLGLGPQWRPEHSTPDPSHPSNR